MEFSYNISYQNKYSAKNDGFSISNWCKNNNKGKEIREEKKGKNTDGFSWRIWIDFHPNGGLA